MKEALALRRQRPLVMEIRDELERMILNGEVEAGERLNENILAEQLGVSRGPVREAARSLEKEGLVTTVANQGVFVRKLSIEDALELYDLRAMMAGYLCALAAERSDATTSAGLRSFVDQMNVAIGTGDEALYFQLNLAFHDSIAAASGAGRAKTLYTSLGKEVQLMRLRVLSGAASLIQSNTEHDLIVAAIESGDTEAARRHGAQHHMNGKARLQATL
ncbi:GntR family transcriptional regulator [Puniceibacterium sp. IMCC21224]|uniref:GntR family transcriptional regulator n=1 Tax=Puniceibacterium sp. IMCC21224 TaxID=1618204 RepID=UPI00064DAD04|nr:GntR family transcriptional regulator [Puniceibacterium sp. IMCC21224]